MSSAPLRLYRRRRPLALGNNLLDQSAVEQIRDAPIEKDTFSLVEDQNRGLVSGAQWRRRRVVWQDADSREMLGLCVNEIRVAPGDRARVVPDIAMANPGLVDFESIENAYWQTVWASGALRVARGERRSRLYVNMRSLTCAPAGAPRGPWEDLEALHAKVASGEFRDDQVDLWPALDPQVRRVEGTDMTIARYLPAYPPSWSVQANNNVHAAINGGYFLNFPEEYEDGLSALHQPVGALFAGNHLHMPPWFERPCAIEWVDGTRRFELLGAENLVLAHPEAQPAPLALGINLPDAAATVWRRIDGPLPRVDEEEPAVDLVFSGAGLASVVKAGTVKEAPLGGAIVRLYEPYAAPWLSWLDQPRTAFPAAELRLQPAHEGAVAWAVAAGPLLVIDGIALDEATMFGRLACGEFGPNGPPPTRFPYDATRTRAPRTAIGLTPRGEWVLVVVDGRADPNHSVGATLEELGRLMRHLGCVQAMNLDGGGSSAMAIEGLAPLDQVRPGLTSMIANLPSDVGHRERVVPVALTVVG